MALHPRVLGGTPPPPRSFLQEHGHVVLVVRVAGGLGVAGAQRGHRVGALPEEEHPAVQACHVELAVGVDALGPEGGPQAVIDEPRSEERRVGKEVSLCV